MYIRLVDTENSCTRQIRCGTINLYHLYPLEIYLLSTIVFCAIKYKSKILTKVNALPLILAAIVQNNLRSTIKCSEA